MSSRRHRRSGRRTSDRSDESSSSYESNDGGDDTSGSTDDSTSDDNKEKRRGRSRDRRSGSRSRRAGRRRRRDDDESSTTDATVSSAETDLSTEEYERQRRQRRRRQRSRRGSGSRDRSRRRRRRRRRGSTDDSYESDSYYSTGDSSRDDYDTYDDEEERKLKEHADAEIAPRAKGDIGTLVVVPSANIFNQFCKDMSIFLSHFATTSIAQYEKAHSVSKERAVLDFVRLITTPVSKLSDAIFDELYRRCVAPNGSDEMAKTTCSQFMTSLQFAASHFVYPDAVWMQIARDVRYGGIAKVRHDGSRFNDQSAGRKSGHIGFVYESSLNRDAFARWSPPDIVIEVFFVDCLAYFVKTYVFSVATPSGNTAAASSATPASKKSPMGERPKASTGVNMVYFEQSNYAMLIELLASCVKDVLCQYATEMTSEAPVWKKDVNFKTKPFSVATVRFMGVNAQAAEDRKAVAAKLSHKVQDTLDKMATDLSSQRRNFERGMASQQQDIKSIVRRAAKHAKKIQLQKAAEEIIKGDKKRRESERKKKKRQAAENSRKRKQQRQASQNASGGDGAINVKLTGSGANGKSGKSKGKKKKDKKRRNKKRKHDSTSSSGSSSSTSSTSDSSDDESSLFSSSD